MRAGNPRHAAVLAAVAVAAVGFLGFRLLGMGGEPLKRAIARRSVAEPLPESAGDLPERVVGNPFSHAKLAVRRTAAAAGPAPVTVSGLIGLPEIAGGIQIRPEGEPPTAADPAENAGSDREVEQAPSQLVLSAILRVEQPVALISLNGGDSKSFVAGDLVARGIRVIEIGRDFALVRIGSKVHRLKPGANVTLQQEVGS